MKWIATSLLASYDFCLACLLFAGLARIGCIPESIVRQCHVQFEMEPQSEASVTTAVPLVTSARNPEVTSLRRTSAPPALAPVIPSA